MAEDRFASDYIQSITDEIEAFTSQLPSAATTWRGADLRYALQRALYFRYANDVAARDRWRRSQLATGWLGRDCAEWLRSRRLRDAALVLPRAGLDAMLEVRSRRSAAQVATGRLAFSVIHPKFVRYAQAIGIDAADTVFYCGTLRDVHAATSAAGVASSAATRLSPWRRLLDVRQPHLHAFGLQRELDAALGFLHAHRPRAVVVIEGNAPSDEVVNRACRLAGVPCVCIQQGWSPIVHAGFRHFSFTKMLVWGPEFGRLLAPFSPEQRFVATGSHIVGPETVEATPLTRRPAVSFFLQAPSPMIERAVWDRFLDLIATVSARIPATPLLVREHPSALVDGATRARLSRMANVELIDPASAPLQEQLARSRVAVSLFSTTLFESAAAGAIPVVVNPGLIRDFVPSLAAAGVGVEVSSWDEAASTIAALASDDAAGASYARGQRQFAARFFNGATREEARVALRAELSKL